MSFRLRSDSPPECTQAPRERSDSFWGAPTGC